MPLLSVWQLFLPLGNFGTVRCGQRLESNLGCRILPGLSEPGWCFLWWCFCGGVFCDVKGVW